MGQAASVASTTHVCAYRAKELDSQIYVLLVPGKSHGLLLVFTIVIGKSRMYCMVTDGTGVIPANERYQQGLEGLLCWNNVSLGCCQTVRTSGEMTRSRSLSFSF